LGALKPLVEKDRAADAAPEPTPALQVGATATQLDPAVKDSATTPTPLAGADAKRAAKAAAGASPPPYDDTTAA